MTERIAINADVMLGKPVIKGTRIPVALLIRKLSEGATVEDLLNAYPRLVVADIQAALVIPTTDHWLATAGSFADDPTLLPMLDEIYAARGHE